MNSDVQRTTGLLADSDAAKHDSAQMNPTPCEAIDRHDGGVRVVFIGNSITLHEVLPAIGWHHAWGMAASAAEKDFVHLVTRGIEERTGRQADVRVRNLSEFERNFRDYDLDKVQDLADFNPDFLIVALGENVPALDDGGRLEYRAAFKSLLARFLPGRAKPLAVVRGVFWPNEWKDAMMAHAASDFAIPFVKADFGDDPAMKALGLFEHNGVQSHPNDAGMAAIAGRILEGLFPTESCYQAWLDGQPLAVRPIRISRQPFNQWAADYQRPVDQTEVAGLLKFETDGPARLRVRVERAFQTARIRPLHTQAEVTWQGQELTLSLPGPGYYVLELDGYHQPLEIFADPKRDFSRERAEANLVFGPGLHFPGVVKLHSHDRVFLDKDAVVYGSFQVDGAEDVKVSGYGIISGSRNRRVGHHCYREGMDGAVRIIDSHRVSFDGPTVLDSCCWSVAVFNSSDLEFARLKVTEAWRYNTDGIDICNSQRVRIHDCFFHSFDDSIVLKGIYTEGDRDEPVEDIQVRDCVCWCGWGRTLEIGLESWAPYFRNIVFESCDLIHNNAGAISVHLGGPAPVEDMTFRDIRLEYDASEQQGLHQVDRDQKVTCASPWSGAWIILSNNKMFSPNNMYSAMRYDSSREPYGNFRRLTVENITLNIGKGAIYPFVGIYPVSGTAFGEIHMNGIRYVIEE
ncbi:MAG: hypothetical protein IJJ33_11930 [Victivallales bacterium]|nr:hypothetical protein [Victivallales bacterium]